MKCLHLKKKFFFIKRLDFKLINNNFKKFLNYNLIKFVKIKLLQIKFYKISNKNNR